VQSQPQRALVVAGFVAAGKTHAAGLPLDFGPVIDLDASLFSYLPSGDRNPNFTNDYIKAIIEHLPDRCVILLSSHGSLRTALVDSGISFTLVYPVPDAKQAWIGRLSKRGTPQYIPIVDSMWDEWLEECKSQEGCDHVTLQADQHLSDVLPLICERFAKAEQS
jgi:hypothetical protein